MKVEALAAPQTSGEVKALNDNQIEPITPKEVRERARKAIAEKPAKPAKTTVANKLKVRATEDAIPSPTDREQGRPRPAAPVSPEHLG